MAAFNNLGPQYQPQWPNPAYTAPSGVWASPTYTPSQQQNSGSILTIQVTSEDEVNNYPVAAGTTVLLLSFNLKKFWLKSTSTNGVPQPLRVFPFDEVTQTPAPNGGVTRDEFDALSKKIDKLISDLGGGSGV